MGISIQNELLHPLSAGYTSAVVTSVTSFNSFQLRLLNAEDLLTAQLAVSCLVQPRCGDKVVVWREANASYIVQILQRASDGSDAVEIRCSSDISLQAMGNIHWNSLQTLSSHAQQQSHHADTLMTHARHSHHYHENLNMTANTTQFSSNTVQLQSENITLVAKRLLQSLEESIRSVSGLDSHTSGTFLQRVKQIFSLEGDRLLLQAKKDVKIDGDKIHMG
ncbi:MAG: DUF3540 domain-containing protein [Gammaproteobacteria bacterium]|nr:DUF3540 domain-containing protein [Gammaproteobacteria bacterium]